MFTIFSRPLIFFGVYSMLNRSGYDHARLHYLPTWWALFPRCYQRRNEIGKLLSTKYRCVIMEHCMLHWKKKYCVLFNSLFFIFILHIFYFFFLSFLFFLCFFFILFFLPSPSIQIHNLEYKENLIRRIIIASW